MTPTVTPVEVARFWRKTIEVARGYESKCWAWTASKNKDGYGQVRVNGTMHLAHRIAWLLFHGTWPPHLCHYCDQPDCVRPSHLWDGDAKQNYEDSRSKGRANLTIRARGERVHGAKLTATEVRALRADALAGLSQYALASKYGVSRPTVKAIVRRHTWKHVD